MYQFNYMVTDQPEYGINLLAIPKILGIFLTE